MFRGLLFGLLGAILLSQAYTLPQDNDKGADRRQFDTLGGALLNGAATIAQLGAAGLNYVATGLSGYGQGADYIGKYSDLVSGQYIQPYAFQSGVVLPNGYQTFLAYPLLSQSFAPVSLNNVVACDVVYSYECYYYYY